MWLQFTRSVLALLALSAPAFGQGAILQGGPSTPGHAPMYIGSGQQGSQTVVQDSGPAGGGGVGRGLSETLQVNRSAAGTGTGPLGTHNCQYDAAVTSGSYHYLCFDANAQGGSQLVFGAGGGAAQLPLTFNINGVSYVFPFVSPQFAGPGIDANILNAQTANYTIGPLDCGKTIQAGTGATGLFTITLPAVGLVAGNCSILIKNADTTRGKILAGSFPSDIAGVLWPQQSVGVKVVNGAWASFYAPGRWHLQAAVNMYVDPVNGNDANDCLGTGTGACKTVQGTINTIAAHFDFSNLAASTIINSPFAITNTSSVSISAPWVGSLLDTPVVLDGNNTGSINETGSGSTIAVFGGGTLLVRNITLSYTGGGNQNILESHFGARNLSIDNVTLNGSTGGGVYVSDSSYFSAVGAVVNVCGAYAGDVFGFTNNSLALFESTTLNITCDVSAPFFVAAGNNSTTDWAFATINLNGHTVTGIRASAGAGGVIQTNDGMANPNFFPGNQPPLFFGVSSYDTTFPGLVGSRTFLTPGNPAGTASTAAFVMMGIAAGINPTATGNVFFTFTGGMTSTLSGDGCFAQIRYGTGAPPANGAAVTGTASGQLVPFTAAANNQSVPFTNVGYTTGLSLHTNYWFDLAVEAVTGGTCSVNNLTVIADER